jgi:hypothetical protein
MLMKLGLDLKAVGVEIDEVAGGVFNKGCPGNNARQNKD